MHVATGTRWVRSLVIVTLLLGAAACSSDPTPAGSVTPSSPTASNDTPSSSPSPTETPVEQQIEATMRAYFEAANEAFRSGSVDNLKDLTAAGCPCRGLARRIQQISADGGRYDGARYDVKDLKVHDVIADSAAVEVLARVPAYKVLKADGTVSQHSKGGKLHTDFSLIRREGEWIITNSFDLG
jgi:hypothetical protein